MARKIRLLFYGDGPNVATGFGTVSRNILMGLHKTGKYDITVYAINHWGNPAPHIPFPLWPIGVGSNDPYGRQRAADMMMARDQQFDVLFMLQDSFILEFMNNVLPKLKAAKKFTSVVYYPIDGIPKKSWIEVMAMFDHCITYTDFGRKESILAHPSIADKLQVIPHGINPKDFYPVPAEDAIEFRKQYFGKHASKYLVCFPEGHKVWTLNGERDIAEIKIGDFALTHKNRYKRVSRTFERDFSGDLIKVSLTGEDSISGTGEHPILAAKRSNVLCKYKDSSRNNYVCRPKEEGVEYSRPCSTCGYYEDYKMELSDFNFIPLKSLEAGDFVLTPIDINFGKYIDTINCWNTSSHLNAKMIPDSVKVSKELMYAFGVWLAEGCYSRNEYGLTGLSINMGDSEASRECLHRFKLGIEKGFGIDSKEYYLEDQEVLMPNGEVFVGDFISLRIFSTNLAAMFYEWFGELSDGKSIPPIFERVSLDMQLALFEGYKDGDGCIRRNNYSNSDRLDCVSASRLLVESIRRILLRNGIFGSIYKEKKLDNRKQMYRYVAQGAGLSSYKNQLDMTKKVRNRFILDGFLVSEIRNVDVLPFNGKVYNLEVEEDNSYTVDNIIVHNCNLNRNQQRKDIPRTLMAFKEFKKRRPNSAIYLHMSAKDQGWNLPEVITSLGLKLGEDVLLPGKDFGPNQGYPLHIVNLIYNACDVVVSSSLGEGWGLSSIEAMATKTPIIFPNNTSLKEIVGKDRGFLVDSGKTVNDFTIIPNDNEVLRPLTSVSHMAETMLEVHDNKVLAKERAENAYQWLMNNLVWEKHIVPKWDKLISDAVISMIKEQSLAAGKPGTISSEEL